MPDGFYQLVPPERIDQAKGIAAPDEERLRLFLRDELPPVLAHEWYNRGYYGTMSHNSKAVYQRYIGWYDANPANLNPLPPEPAAKRYVEAMGGTAATSVGV